MLIIWAWLLSMIVTEAGWKEWLLFVVVCLVLGAIAMLVVVSLGWLALLALKFLLSLV